MNDANKSPESLFHAALELPPEERAAYLQEVCAGDSALRQRIASLLQAHQRADAFMDNPATTALQPAEQPGEKIHRYKLLEKIGEGGCGVVYMAEQTEPVRRRVALKIIKLGMDTKMVVARFEAERQALAMMEHPHIAMVFDAGTTERGRPYFVMELVRGLKITEFCDQNHLSMWQRLDLFIQICHAIQHAHQKGIIHRDIKPSNVLVTVNDGVPVPKVIDFGIAKATTGQPLTDKTLFTAFAQFIGTPAYMSPEQAALTSVDIDTRSDIYGLGVLLYELLTGKTPFDAKELLASGWEAMRQSILEREPPRPSTRLSTMMAAELATTARDRQAEAPKLISLLRGDLDWIVMRALEKDRARRYETANGLAMDVKRFLANEPVVARPPSAAYRLQKAFRRNKLIWIATVAVAAALISGMGLSTFLFLRERRSHQEAVTMGHQAELAARRESQQRARAAKGEAEANHLLYAADMNLAQQYWEQNNIGQVRRLLAETQSLPDRGFEWCYWQRQTHLELRALSGHIGTVQEIAFSPDGSRVLTVGARGAFKIWDPGSGRELFASDGFKGARSKVDFFGETTRVFTILENGTAEVRDGSSGQVLITLQSQAPSYPAERVAISSDWRRILRGGYDRIARVWDATTGKEVLTLKGHKAPISAAAFSRNGERIVTVSGDGSVKTWDAASGQELLTFRCHVGSTAVVYSPDGRRIVTAGSGKSARLWDATNGQELLAFEGHSDSIMSAAFSEDGKRLVTAGSDGLVEVWDALNGHPLLTIKGHRESVDSVAFSPDGLQLLTGSADGTAKLWDATANREVLEKGPGPVNCVAFSPDGQRLITGGFDGAAVVRVTASGQKVFTLKGHGASLHSAAFSPDGRLIVTGASSHDPARVDPGSATATVWNARDGRELFTFKGHTSSVCSVSFSPESQHILSGSLDRTAKVWDAATGQELLTLRGHGKGIHSACFSPDGHRIVTGSEDNTAKVWDADTGNELFTLRGHSDAVWSVSFSPDGQKILTGSHDRTARVWNATNGNELFALKGDGAALWAVAFSSSGRRILTGNGKGSAKLWDAISGRELLTLKVDTFPVLSVAFSPDGLRIATAGSLVRIWAAASPEEVARWQAQEGVSDQNQPRRNQP